MAIAFVVASTAVSLADAKVKALPDLRVQSGNAVVRDRALQGVVVVNNRGRGRAARSDGALYVSSTSPRFRARLGPPVKTLALAKKRSTRLRLRASLPESVRSAGSYRVEFCADDRKVVAELSESNNCRVIGRFQLSATPPSPSTTPAPTSSSPGPAAEGPGSGDSSTPPSQLAPVVALVSAPASITRSRAASIGFHSATPGATFECRVDAAAFEACQSPWSTGELADGAHEVQVVASAGGRRSEPATTRWIIDTIGPRPKIISPDASRSAVGATTFEFDSDDADAVFECRLDDSAWNTCRSPLTVQATAGPHSLAVRASDPAGNLSDSVFRAWRSVPAKLDLCGEITSDRTLGPDHALVYVLTCSVTVKPGVTLTLEPGTELRAGVGHALNVGGSVVAEGSPREPIVLGATPTAASWDGIRAAAGSNLDFSWVQLDRANQGVEAYQSSNVNVHSSTFTRSRWLRLHGCELAELIGNRFEQTSLSVDKCSATLLRNTFLETDFPLSINGHASLADVAFAGTDANRLVGVGRERLAQIKESYVAEGTSWALSPGAAVYNPNNLTVYGTVDVEPAAVLKTNAPIQNRGGGFSVRRGGRLTLNGTAANPVTATSLGDSSIAGDSTGGSNSSPATTTWASGLVTINDGGTLVAKHTDFRWLVYPLIAEYEAAGRVEVTHSSFVNPEPLNASGTRVEAGSVSIRGCSSSTFSNNRFDRVALGLTQCDASVNGNTFKNASRPLVINVHPDVAKVDLSGPGANTFLGQGSERVVEVGGSTIPAGKNWDLAEGPVYNPQGVIVRGTVRAAAGTVFKTDQETTSGSGGFSVRGGRLALKGTSAAPITATTLRDDSVGGDSTGDGNTSPTRAAWGTNLATLSEGGSLEVEHTAFRWLTHPIAADFTEVDYTPAGETSIIDSSFDLPQTVIAEGITVESIAVSLQGCSNATFARNQFRRTALQLHRCKARIEGGTYTQGLHLSESPVTISNATISNPGGTALDVLHSEVTATGTTIRDATVAIEIVGKTLLAYRGSIRSITGDQWIKSCDWKGPDCAVDASGVDWGLGGPFTSKGKVGVCGQVLVERWIGATPAPKHDAFRAHNCDGTVYRPDEEISKAASYANARLAAAYALCDPDEPAFRDACEVYERFYKCYGAVLELAKAGSTFPIPDSPQGVAEGLTGALSDGIASSPNPFDSLTGQKLQMAKGVLQVVSIAVALRDAYYSCSP